MPGQLEDVVAGKNPINNGSNETETNEPIARPRGPCAPNAATTATDVGTCAMTSRNRADVAEVMDSEEPVAAAGEEHRGAQPEVREPATVDVEDTVDEPVEL